MKDSNAFCRIVWYAYATDEEPTYMRSRKEDTHMLTNRRKTIGVFMNKTDRCFEENLRLCAAKRARELGYDIYFFCTVGYRESGNYYDAQEKAMFDFAPIERLDAILCAPDTYQMYGFRESLMKALKARATCPIACVRDRRSPYDCLYTDESVAIRPLVRHLIEDHGLRKICFLAGYKGHIDGDARMNCYIDEMTKHGLPLPNNAIYYGTMWTDRVKEAYDYFFADPDDRPEAIVCANDYMAVPMMELVTAAGYRVPEDVVVTGFDDISEASNHLPTLTTVAQDYAAMVTQAVDLLDRRIREREQDLPELPVQRVGVPGRLELRESCGCKTPDLPGYRIMNRLNYEESQFIMNRQISQTYFSVELNGCDSYQDVHDVISRKIGDITDCRDFYLCLFEHERDNDPEALGEYAQTMTGNACLLLAIKDNKDYGMLSLSFDRRLLLPAFAEKDEPQAFYLMLLHQRDRCYGYTVMQYQPDKLPSIFYHHWNVIISNALRHLNNQQTLQRLYEERRLSSVTDALTGLYNRRGFEEQLEQCWDQKCATRESVCFIGFDLDGLKYINDTFGHIEGDRAIRIVGEAIARAGDGRQVAARIGGDEFAAFLPACDELRAHDYLERFERALEELNGVVKRAFLISASAGAYVTRLSDGVTVEDCLRQSDVQMYVEKCKRKLDHHTGKPIA